MVWVSDLEEAMAVHNAPNSNTHFGCNSSFLLVKAKGAQLGIRHYLTSRPLFCPAQQAKPMATISGGLLRWRAVCVARARELAGYPNIPWANKTLIFLPRPRACAAVPLFLSV